MTPRLALISLAVILLVACAPTGGQALVAPLEEVSALSEQAVQLQTARPVVAPLKGVNGESLTSPEEAPAQAPPASCAVTRPPKLPFTPPAPWPATAPYAGQFWYGSDALWTALPVDGVWNQLAYGEKVFWWRAGYVGSDEPQPGLSITARRLDRDAPEVTSPAPATNAFHPDFDWAMLSGLQVPTPGCWEVSGHYAGATLTFVVWVAP